MDNQNVKGVDDVMRRLHEALEYFQDDVPDVVGIEAVKHFKANFEEQGFVDKGTDKWAPRKTKQRLQRKVLTGQTSGDHLADSIDYRREGKNVIVFTDKEYAQVHNEGGIIEVTEKMRKYFWAQYYMAKEDGDTELMEQWKFMALSKEITIPKRQYMGESEALMEKITAKIVRDLTRILNG